MTMLSMLSDVINYTFEDKLGKGSPDKLFCVRFLKFMDHDIEEGIVDRGSSGDRWQERDKVFGRW